MSYGVTVDYFGLADTGNTVVLQSSEYSPSYATDASVADEYGDFRCRTKAGQVDEYSSVYKLCGGGDSNNSVGIEDTTTGLGIQIGSTVAMPGDSTSAIMITGIEGATTNADFPTVTVTGIKEATGLTHEKYTSGISVTAKKTAQTFGLVALSAGHYVTAGSFEISGSTATAEDSNGDIVCREPFGFRITASNTIQNCTTTPTGTEDTANGWGLESPTGTSETNTDYGTATVEVFKDLVKDTLS